MRVPKFVLALALVAALTLGFMPRTDAQRLSDRLIYVTAVTTLSAANSTVTLTLPAGGATLHHYITRIEAKRTCTAAITGTALLAYTTTNLPGSLAFTAGNACAVGANHTDFEIDFQFPLRSEVANTNTTIVAPAAGAAGQIRLTAYYYLSL